MNQRQAFKIIQALSQVKNEAILEEGAAAISAKSRIYDLLHDLATDLGVEIDKDELATEVYGVVG